MAYDFAKHRNEVKVLNSKIPKLPEWEFSQGNSSCNISFFDSGDMYINNSILGIAPEEARKIARFILDVLGEGEE